MLVASALVIRNRGAKPVSNLLARYGQLARLQAETDSPVSFQQLTSAQSSIYPLNPVFYPFIAIMMRISFPSNNIYADQYPRKRCTN